MVHWIINHVLHLVLGFGFIGSLFAFIPRTLKTIQCLQDVLNLGKDLLIDLQKLKAGTPGVTLDNIIANFQKDLLTVEADWKGLKTPTS